MSVQPPTLVDIHKKRGIRPEFDTYIGRQMTYPPSIRDTFPEDSKWHNPFTFKEYGEAVLWMYEEYIKSLLIDDRRFPFPLSDEKWKALEKAYDNAYARWSHWDLVELTGMRLGCWCITTDSWENPVCHGQILMKLWHEAWTRGELDES